MAPKKLRVATRSSPLALWQANYIAEKLNADVELVKIQTAGDKQRDVPIEDISGRGVFVKEVQRAVLDGRADIAVHSAKDLMSEEPPGLIIGCVPERGDPRDALVGKSIADLGPGASVATGSIRRRVQLAELRPDLTFYGLRGNIDTRLQKAKNFDIIVIAYASIQRLGRVVPDLHVLEPETMLPQVAQGALAVECRQDDDATLNKLAAIEHRNSRRAVDAERAFLGALGGGCDLPIAGYATIENDAVFMRAMMASMDGHTILRVRDTAQDGEALGRELPRKLLDDFGGREMIVQRINT